MWETGSIQYKDIKVEMKIHTYLPNSLKKHYHAEKSMETAKLVTVTPHQMV
jgi:hypothetical protein